MTAAPARLALVRHAESTWVAESRFQGRLDPPLSDRGIRQARLLAERLAAPDRNLHLPLPPIDPVGIWHSPLERARATAEPLRALLPGVRVIATEALLELGQGDWEGRLHGDVAADDGDRLAAWRRSPTTANAPDGERLVDASARVRGCLAGVIDALGRASRADDADASEPWALILAHDGVLRLALLALLELPLERFWAFPFSLCGISVVELGGATAALRAHGLVDHLLPLTADPIALAEARGERGGAL
ncbi:MAG TPA: histidine phosphatase family protein [Candidatus Limnocylindrales bacterium]|nr:histidine phosphatase family protein [Candidatus Limnocylindrales bacterium]